MSNRITIELCAEDRARLDKLASIMEAHIAQAESKQPEPKEEQAEEEQAEEEQASQEEPTQEELVKTVTHAELMAKVIELSAKDVKLKAQVRDVILVYAPRVKAVPEDKLAECYKKLVALEG